MKASDTARSTARTFLALLVVGAAACETGDLPTAVDGTPTVVLGQLSRVTVDGSSAGVAGFTVRGADGASALTDRHGHFRLETAGTDGLDLHFARGGVAGDLRIPGAPGGFVQLDVELVDRTVLVRSSSPDRALEFEGAVTEFGVAGETGARVLDVVLGSTAGERLAVITEGVTSFDGEGDLVDLTSLLGALESGVPGLRIEGRGVRRDDGAIEATMVKAEVDGDDGADDVTDDDGDDDGDDDHGGDDSAPASGFQVQGTAALVDVLDDATGRALIVELTRTVLVDTVTIIEGDAVFDPAGDLVTFEALRLALGGTRTVRIEGIAQRRDDGTVLLRSLKAETDGDAGQGGSSGPPSAAVEFQGAVTLIEASGDAPTRTLVVEVAEATGNWTVVVDEGVALFDNEGDVVSFSDFAGVLAAGVVAVRAEGDGSMNEDGQVAAIVIKVEIDD